MNDEKPEKPAGFFDKRLSIFEERQLDCIEHAKDFYPFSASLLPKMPKAQILDLRCGSGLQLKYYFSINPSAHITGINLGAKMLEKLKEQLHFEKMTLIQGSYFDIELGNNCFDGAVAPETLHHFIAAQKIGLYRRFLLH